MEPLNSLSALECLPSEGRGHTMQVSSLFLWSTVSEEHANWQRILRSVVVICAIVVFIRWHECDSRLRVVGERMSGYHLEVQLRGGQYLVLALVTNHLTWSFWYIVSKSPALINWRTL